MEISSATSILPQAAPTATTPTRAEERLEGNRPDNDGDKDDAVSSVASQSTNTTGSIGTRINVTV